ncbi:hypothetical protein FHS23_004191 [Prauserella isguenensis]|uniref:Uncharacterized protein n=1 Tax=Prauserella isguenensis TaxID=1470180 RepID=A0A839S617_9PSEU|nr:hypothetical protein [Prauserella isguenensis]MBB3053148.1 hypothetical protein [Prauserella isguenensis]
MWDAVARAGYGYDTLGLRAPYDVGTVLVELEDHRRGGANMLAALGLHRPPPAQVLVTGAAEAGG